MGVWLMEGGGLERMLGGVGESCGGGALAGRAVHVSFTLVLL